MAIELLFFVAGFALLVKGADILVDGAASIATKLRVSALMIGLTVVALGTSMPELGVNIAASLGGENEITLGNIVGSNIANILLILGFTALIIPLRVKNETLWKEIPYGFMAALVLLVIASDSLIMGRRSVIDTTDSYILLLFFSIFLAYVIGTAKAQRSIRSLFKREKRFKEFSAPLSIAMVIGGIIGVAVGGQWVVYGAVYIAGLLGLSEFLIGATIIAIGTSLPELVTSVVAAFKRQADIMIGIISGSNIFNISFILGISGLIRPIAVDGMRTFDLMFLLLASGLLFVFVFLDKKRLLSRREGVVFLLLFLAYILFTVWRG